MILPDKCILFLFNSGNVYCGQIVEFEESDGYIKIFIININIKNKQVKIRQNLNVVILKILI